MDPLQDFKVFGDPDSVVDELISHLDHGDPTFKLGHASVYSLPEKTTRGKVYAPNAKPYQRQKDVRRSWMPMIISHAVEERW